MFNRAAFWNTRPDGVGVLEVEGGGETRRFVPLKRTEVRGEIAGPLAALRVAHTYGFSRVDSALTLEAVYRFPLPGDAAVTGVTVRFGEVEIVAELQGRERAEATYAGAKERGEQAALAMRESPDVFTLRIAGLRPDEPITVETAYVQLARPTTDGWSLRLPLTTAPRYVREDERGSRAAAGQPLALLRDPGHRFALDLTIRGVEGVASPTHALLVEDADDGEATRVRLRDGEVLPDRDCVLTWAARRDARRPALTVLTHDDPDGGYRYFLALVAPPRDGAAATPTAREVVLLVDHSGSMSGPKWAAADWATRSFLGGLNAGDAFALGVFHDTTKWFARATRPATPETVTDATTFLLAQGESGGTNLGVALEGALGLPRASGERARHILIVTDAEVSDAARILRLADTEAGRDERRRISVLCIDAAPNALLATELADRGGVSRFLTSAPEEDDITTALDEVLMEWAAPVHANLRLAVNRPGVEPARGRAADVGEGWGALDLGDLPSGRAVWVTGRVRRDEGALAFRLLGASPAAAPLAQLDRAEEGRSLPALKALFGTRRVLGLEGLPGTGYDDAQLREQLAHLGYDSERALAAPTADPPKVYAENARADTTAALRDLLVSEALTYGLASAETAFVAIRHEAGERVAGTIVVANALPSGWSPGFLGGGMLRQAGGRMLRTMAFGSGLMAASESLPVTISESPIMRFARPRTSLRRPAPSAAPASAPTGLVTLFAGVPQFAGGEAVIFDSAGDGGGRVTAPRTIARLALRFRGGSPADGTLDPALALAIFVDDLAAPRATVRLTEMIRQGGERPLNLAWRANQVLRIVIVDPAGAWAGGGPEIEVLLG